jgi:Protein of unknown function (DUF3037)
MQQQHLFEYAVLRIVPQVEREEFLNVGVILYCAKQQFLQVKFKVQEERFKLFSCELNMDEIKNYLKGFELICVGADGSGAIGKLPIAERFRWLTATRSTVLQTSKVHPGFCEDAGEKLEQIFEQLVS